MTSENASSTVDSDELEPSGSVTNSTGLPAVVGETRASETEQYLLHLEHVPLLPGQILTEAISRLRFTIVLVSFFYTGLIFIVTILAISLIAPNLLFWMDTNSPILINTARIITSLLAIGLSFACIGIVIKHRELTEKLALAEVVIDRLRDVTLIQMQATRYNMEDLSERLKFPREAHAPSPLDYIDLARRLGPILQLLLAKERSVMTIAVEGVKLFQVLKKVLNK